MSNKTLLYTSSLLPIFLDIFLWLARTPGWVLLHLQLAPKQPRRLPGLSVFPSNLKALLKISNQVLSQHCPQNRLHLATILDTCKNGLCLVLFTASWAWDTWASKCTCLHERRLDACFSHILGPNLCAPWDCVSLSDLSSPIYHHLSMDFVCLYCFRLFGDEHHPNFTLTQSSSFRWRNLHIFGIIQAQTLEQPFPRDVSHFKECPFPCESSVETRALCISHGHWEGCFSTNSKAFWLEHYL